jgi:hypothetical protein
MTLYRDIHIGHRIQGPVEIFPVHAVITE